MVIISNFTPSSLTNSEIVTYTWELDPPQASLQGESLGPEYVQISTTLGLAKPCSPSIFGLSLYTKQTLNRQPSPKCRLLVIYQWEPAPGPGLGEETRDTGCQGWTNQPIDKCPFWIFLVEMYAFCLYISNSKKSFTYKTKSDHNMMTRLFCKIL